MTRISQSMLYNNFIRYLDQTTSELQRLYNEGSSQKKINKPSDNPVGMARILSYRDSLKALDQYKNNINNAKGWLGLADTTLSQVEKQLTRLKELAVQASNGTLNESDRQDIVKEMRQIYDQLIALSNTKYEGKSIFGGHKTHTDAYVKGLAVASNKTADNGEDDVIPYVRDIEGSSDETLVVKFSKKDTAKATIGVDDGIIYTVYKGDKVVADGELNAGDTTLNLGGVTLKLAKGYEVVTDSSLAGEDNTELTIYPTAYYQGDNVNRPGVEVYDNFSFKIDPEDTGSFASNIRVKILTDTTIGSGTDVEYQYSIDGGKSWSKTLYAENNDTTKLTLDLPGGKINITDLEPSGSASSLSGLQFGLHGLQVKQLTTSTIHSFATGDITKNTVIRIDNIDTTNNIITYSYSQDGGETWNEGHEVSIATTQTYVDFPVPGGLFKVATVDIPSLNEGDQFVIQPRHAYINSEISTGVSLPINNIGPNIFGGHYKNDSGLEVAFESDQSKNLFETVGKLISSLETNDVKGIQDSLDRLDASLTQVGEVHADIGARLNRLDTANSILSDLEVNQKERKSYIEDVDFADLLTKISQQQVVYEALLKSASMIMKMSLVNFV